MKTKTNKEEMAKEIIKEGRVFASSGEYKRAKEKFIEAGKVYKSMHNRERTAWCDGAAAYMAFICGEFEEGTSLCKQAGKNGYDDIEKLDEIKAYLKEEKISLRKIGFYETYKKVKGNINKDKKKEILNSLSKDIISPTPQELKKLNSIVPDSGIKDDFESILFYIKWVHDNLKHDPTNKPSKCSPLTILKEKTEMGFTCREFAVLGAGVLQAKGYKSRVVTLLKKNFHYGYGKTHWVLEAYLPSLRKWVLFDTQNNCYWKYEDKLLSGNEIKKLKMKDLSPNAYVNNILSAKLKSWLEYFDIARII
ncbi:MAG: transglutaminase-like domain-containing protein [Lentimicrobiaceae bacterium]|nr:transglutaminase-like domain-containing protein [Lentimicrobiaceae bacterium]